MARHEKNEDKMHYYNVDRLTGERVPHEYNRRLSGNEDLLKDVSKSKVEYADQILPFDITVNFANEYGDLAKTTLEGVEILNEGMGIGLDDLAMSQEYTFVARDIQELGPVSKSGELITPHKWKVENEASGPDMVGANVNDNGPGGGDTQEDSQELI